MTETYAQARCVLSGRCGYAWLSVRSKALRALLDETLQVAEEWGLPLSDPEQGQGRLVCTTKSSEVFDA